MQIQLNQAEIDSAVRNMLGKFGISPEAVTSVEFKAGRGDNGLTADIELSSLSLNMGAATAKVDATPVTGGTVVPADKQAEAPVAKTTKVAALVGKTPPVENPAPLQGAEVMTEDPTEGEQTTEAEAVTAPPRSGKSLFHQE
jgi:hypothetical protein